MAIDGPAGGPRRLTGAGLLVLTALVAPLAPPAMAQPNPHAAARAVWIAPAGDALHPAASRAHPAPEGRPAGGGDIRTRPEDPWFGQDKVLHFGASFLLTLSGQYVLENKMNLPEARALPVSAGTALSFGLFKEFADSQRPHRPLFSWRDMAWNTAGVALAVTIIAL